jgi:hypothetical protein
MSGMVGQTNEIYEDVEVFEENPELLRNTPSRKDDVDEETECMLRIYGCELIQVWLAARTICA